MAEALLRHMLKADGISGIEVYSRGIGVWDPQPMSENARETLKAAGIDPGPHESRSLTEEDVDRADWILVMTKHHQHVILKNFPQAQDKARLLASEEIDDPVGGSPKDFEKCKMDIQNALLELLPALKAERTSS